MIMITLIAAVLAVFLSVFTQVCQSVCHIYCTPYTACSAVAIITAVASGSLHCLQCS